MTDSDTTTTMTPTVYLVIGGEAIAFDENGEILCTDLITADGPKWDNDACVADYRGTGGKEGFDLLFAALEACEKNARLIGCDPIVRLPGEEMTWFGEGGTEPGPTEAAAS